MKLVFIKKKFSVYGGAERYLETFLKEMVKEGHQVDVLSRSWEEMPGLRFHHVPVVSFDSSLSVFTFNRNVRKTLSLLVDRDCVISFERTEGQDIYRAGEGVHAEWLAIRRRFEPALKRLWLRFSPLHRYMLGLEARIFRNTPVIIANSRMVKEQIVHYYQVSAEKIHIVYNGVDLRRFTPDNRPTWRNRVRHEAGLDAADRVILFVGTGFVRKGLSVLLKALQRLEDPHVKLLVAGHGESRALRADLARRGLADRVVFIGTSKQIERFYAAADLFVLPTLYDPFSNATIEALAAGLPVITSRSNGVSEIISEGCEGEVLEDCSDAAELAGKIGTCLDNVDAMGSFARQLAEQYPIEHATQRFEQIVFNWLDR